MTSPSHDFASLFQPEEIRLTGNGRAIPSVSCLAEYLRASATTLYDVVPPGTGGNPAPFSGRMARFDVTERLKPLFSFGTTARDALFGESEDELDVTARELRAVFDALVTIGDFIDVGNGRYFPSRTRAVALAPDTWILISGAASESLGLADSLWYRRSLSRVVSQLPDIPLVEQSLNSWLGLHAPDYVRFARAQLALPLEPLRQGTAGWNVARIESPRTDWVDPEMLFDLTELVIARFRSDEQHPWHRVIAKLQRGTEGVECVAVRSINYGDCSRILHGQKVLRGFLPRLRSTESDTESRVYCDSYYLAEVQQLLLALCFDCKESGATTEYRVAKVLRPVLVTTLAKLGVQMSGDTLP